MDFIDNTTGLPDPIHDSQAVFRSILRAMAQPGLVRTISLPVTAPSPMHPSVAAVALSMFDSDVSVWLSPSMDGPEIRSFLELRTGVEIVDQPGDADFVIAATIEDLSFDDCKAVDPRSPHVGATIIFQVSSLEGGEPVTVSGPGIENTVEFKIAGLTSAFWDSWNRNAALFPRGVDVIFADDQGICGLPRTAKRV